MEGLAEALAVAKSAGSLGGLGVFVLIALALIDRGYLRLGKGDKKSNGHDPQYQGAPSWAQTLIKHRLPIYDQKQPKQSL